LDTGKNNYSTGQKNHSTGHLICCLWIHWKQIHLKHLIDHWKHMSSVKWVGQRRAEARLMS